MPKQAEAKRDGIINLTKLQFQAILYGKFWCISKRYEWTEVDRRNWLHVSSGTHLSTSSDTHKVVEYEKRLLLRCIHHFKPDIIYNIYVQFEGMLYQQIVEIPIGTNCAPLIANLFLFYMERDLCLTFTNLNSMTLKDMLTTLLYILMIYSPSITSKFEKHIPNIYIHCKFRWTKQIYSSKEVTHNFDWFYAMCAYVRYL